MKIRLAKITDLEDILKIKAVAFNFMLKEGNKNQWIDDYPKKELLLNDIKNKHLYLITKNNIPHAFFYFNIEIDSTYINIYEGKWLNNKPYGVIHRLASDLVIKDVFQIAFEFALKNINNLRVDTYKDNYVMLHLLNKYHFHRCGIIYVKTSNFQDRIAFQFVKE